jgi:hypothetical protein
MATGRIYFHSPCFDGIVSAVLAWDFLEKTEGWVGPLLRSVNYERRGSWLREPLEQPAAVVDFLYHPGAQFWADHHLTSFVEADARAHYNARRDRCLIYDEGADSCAGLLWRRLHTDFGHRNPRYAELVTWADKIDAARYESVEEATSSDAPALRLALGLAVGNAAHYSESVVDALHNLSLSEVADLPDMRQRYSDARARFDAGLDRFKRSARLEDDGIVVFDIDGAGTLVSRYAPYRVYPEARYSVGIVRGENGAKLTAMRNPWREFPSVPLGRIAERLGGGGHQRIGAVMFQGQQAARSGAALDEFLRELRKAERAASSQP